MTTLKVKMMFSLDLAQAAASGIASIGLFTAMRLLCVSWRGDTQEIEGINSLLKCSTNRAPHITLALVDARVSLQKQLWNEKQSKKWSDMAERADEILREAVEAAPMINTVLGDMRRFAVEKMIASEAPLTATPSMIAGEARSATALEWAKPWALKLHRIAKSSSCDVGCTFNVEECLATVAFATAMMLAGRWRC